LAHLTPFCAVRIFLLLLQKNSSMTFDITIIGYIAGFCTALAQFPQALKVIKTGNTQSISTGMYTIMTLGIFFWFLYGFLLSNVPMMLANGVCLIPSIYILCITIRNIYKTKKIMV
jgi:MtN3 and saliva related transmembrane protein